METNRLNDLIISMSLTFNSSPEKSEVFDAFDIVGDRTLKWRGLQNNQYASSRRRNSRMVNSGSVDCDPNITVKTEGSESVSEGTIENGFIGDETLNSLSLPNNRDHNEDEDSVTNSKLYSPSSSLELSQSQEVPCKRRSRGRPAKKKNVQDTSVGTVPDKLDEIAGTQCEISEIIADPKNGTKTLTSCKLSKPDKCEEDSNDLYVNDKKNSVKNLLRPNSKTKISTTIETQIPDDNQVDQKFKTNSDGITTESSNKSKFLRRSKRHSSVISSYLPDESSMHEPVFKMERGFDKTEYDNGSSESILLCDLNDTKIDLKPPAADSIEGRTDSPLDTKGKYDNTMPASRRSSRLKRCTSKLLITTKEAPLDNISLVQSKPIRTTRAKRHFTKHKLGRPPKDSQLSNKNVLISNKNATEIVPSTRKMNKNKCSVATEIANDISKKFLRRGRKRKEKNIEKDKDIFEDITATQRVKIKRKNVTSLKVDRHLKATKIPLNGKITAQFLLKPKIKISNKKGKKKKLHLRENHHKQGSNSYIRFSMKNEQNFDISTVKDKCSYLRLLGLNKASREQRESTLDTVGDVKSQSTVSGVDDFRFSSDVTYQSAIVKTEEEKLSQEKRSYLTCLCEGEPIQMLVHREQVSFCHALDNINGTIVGCMNKIEDDVYPKLFRPSHRVQYMTLCIDHASRLRRHNCCSLCGIFCTQGNFIICKSQHIFHASCAKLFSQVHNIDETPDCHHCPHCGNSETYKIYIMSMKCRKLPIFSITTNSSLL